MLASTAFLELPMEGSARDLKLMLDLLWQALLLIFVRKTKIAIRRLLIICGDFFQ
jgi:hypothetical protein